MPDSLQDFEARRAELVKQFARLGDLRSGSVSNTSGRCGKPNCHCHQRGQAVHGPNVRLTCKVQGKTVTDVSFLGAGPWFASFQAGAFRADLVRAHTSGKAPVNAIGVQLTAAQIRTRPLELFKEAKSAVDLTQAPLIVAIGRGIKAPENIPQAEAVAKAMGAEIAASRPICDEGWLPMERQIGSSGQTVAPKLYLALGISGAIQHVVGMKGARTIVAINKDQNAPIFEIADYGVVGDIFEIMPALTEELQKAK